MKFPQTNRKTILVNQTKTEYICYWNGFSVYEVHDELTDEKFLIRFTEGSDFAIDRNMKNDNCLYWIYEDQPFHKYRHKPYFRTESETKNYGRMLYFRVRKLTPKNVSKIKLKYPEFFI